MNLNDPEHLHVRPCSWYDGACEHGRQRRKCEVCELIETEAEVARLTKDLAAARAALKALTKNIESLAIGADQYEACYVSFVFEIDAAHGAEIEKARKG